MQPSNTILAASTFYPFALNGPLCPLLNDAELLSGFYADSGFRQGIKQFCKKTAWPGKPVISFAIDPAKLKELLLSLFNSPEGREKLRVHGLNGRCPFLDNAIWQWLSTGNPALVQRISGSCEDIKDRLYIKPEPLQKLLTEIQKEQPAPAVVTQLAYVVLAFTMLQPEDRYSLAEVFLAIFPEFTAKFCGGQSA